MGVGETGRGVTGSAVGTGAGGLMLFLMLRVIFSKRQETALRTLGICISAIAARHRPASMTRLVFIGLDMRGSVSLNPESGLI